MIEFLAGTPVGGGQDRAARALAAAFGVTAHVANVAGRGGSNAWEMLATRSGDPSVVAISSPTLITNQMLGLSDLDDRDLTPLAQLCTEYLAFVVATGSMISGPDELLNQLAEGRATTALAVARGNVNHMALGAVVGHCGGDVVANEPRVFDSAQQAVTDVLGGGADVAVVSVASVVEALETGAARVIATTAPTQLAAPFDDAAPWVDLGVDCTLGTWRGVVGPARLSAEQVASWDEAVANAVATAAWLDSVARYRWTPSYLDSGATSAFLARQRAMLGAALTGLGLIDLGGGRISRAAGSGFRTSTRRCLLPHLDKTPGTSAL